MGGEVVSDGMCVSSTGGFHLDVCTYVCMYWYLIGLRLGSSLGWQRSRVFCGRGFRGGDVVSLRCLLRSALVCGCQYSFGGLERGPDSSSRAVLWIVVTLRDFISIILSGLWTGRLRRVIGHSVQWRYYSIGTKESCVHNVIKRNARNCSKGSVQNC